MIREHDRVVLRENLPVEGLAIGDIGTVVHVYAEAAAFEVEFVTLTGQTLSVVTLESKRVRPVGARELASARPLTAA